MHKIKIVKNILFLKSDEFDDIFESIKMSLPQNVAVNMKYYGDKENATDFLYMGEKNVKNL